LGHLGGPRARPQSTGASCGDGLVVPVVAADLVVVDSLPGDVGTVSSSVVGVVTGDSVVVGRAVVAGRGRVVDGGGTDVVAIAGVTGGWGSDGPGAMATTSVLVVDDVVGAPDGP